MRKSYDNKRNTTRQPILVVSGVRSGVLKGLYTCVTVPIHEWCSTLKESLQLKIVSLVSRKLLIIKDCMMHENYIR